MTVKQWLAERRRTKDVRAEERHRRYLENIHSDRRYILYFSAAIVFTVANLAMNAVLGSWWYGVINGFLLGVVIVSFTSTMRSRRQIRARRPETVKLIHETIDHFDELAAESYMQSETTQDFLKLMRHQAIAELLPSERRESDV